MPSTFMYIDSPQQSGYYGDCGVWVCINMERVFCQLTYPFEKDTAKVALEYRHRMGKAFFRSRIEVRSTVKGSSNVCVGILGQQTRSFVNYAPPVIIVDGAHLKSRYLGTNLIAVAMDANNGILPLSYGIGAGETTDHWKWFFGNLRDSLQSSGCCIVILTIISDRAPAIDAGISNVFSEVFHALCARHLLGNLKSVSKRVKSYEWHYWKMCKAYRKSDFDHHYGILCIPDSARTLTTVGFNRWSRHHADRVRYAYLTSNSAESMNALSVHARKLPITMLLEFFRASVQQWFWEHRNTADGLTTPVTPYAERKLGKRNRKSISWTLKPISQVKFEVLDMKKGGKVNLQDKTCTCKQWQFSGIPCGHVMAVARYFVLRNVTTHVQKYFHTETYKSAYMEDINTLDHISKWIDPGHLQTVLPPLVTKRQSGRPKSTARIPTQGEDKDNFKSKRKCSRYLEYGHTRSTCTAHYDLSEGKQKSKCNSKRKAKPKGLVKGKGKGKCEDSCSTQFGSTYNLSDD
ncbi:uncharacterized protein [Rutidosis leptorrhynchoides]|uniref:uncharacterized protein n=1 Tax=Rutidosis leptorrhynchoides TaxID=125765 RepID=UPI003A99EAFA